MRASFIVADAMIQKPVRARMATRPTEGTATRRKASRALIAASIGIACSLMSCGDDFDAACSPWCTVVDDCTETSFSECMNACAEESSQARAISSECANAVRDQNVCLGGLTCAEFEAWVDEDPPDGYPCKSADDEVENACLP